MFETAAPPDEVAAHQPVFDREFEALALSAERSIARYVAAVAGVAGVVSIWVAAAVSLRLGTVLALLAVSAIIYYGLVMPRWLASEHGCKVLRLVNVTTEVTLPAVITLVDVLLVGPGYALASTPPLLAFLAVAASGLRVNPWLSLYAGGLAAAQYLALYALAHPLPPALLDLVPSLAPGFALNHAIYLLLAGGLAAIVAWLGRRVAWRTVRQILEQQRIRGVMGQYLSPEAAERVLAGPVTLSGERREVTVLFADIRGFTRLSSTIAPEAVVAFLNDYFGRVCEVIERHGGMVNKFMGDGLLAVFGAPEALPDHALRACRAALEMVAAAGGLTAPDGTPVRIGAGVHTGPLVLGSIGSARRKDYTVIGDTVNLASRIEGLTKQVGAAVLVSEAARRAAGGALQTEDAGDLPVKGRDEPARVHRLLGVRENPATAAA